MLETNLHRSCWSPPDGMMLDGSDKENPICFSFVRLIKAIWAILFFVQGNDGNCPVIYWVCPLANKKVVKVCGSGIISWNSVKLGKGFGIFPRQIYKMTLSSLIWDNQVKAEEAREACIGRYIITKLLYIVVFHYIMIDNWLSLPKYSSKYDKGNLVKLIKAEETQVKGGSGRHIIIG